jgi:hypothetical protein
MASIWSTSSMESTPGRLRPIFGGSISATGLTLSWFWEIKKSKKARSAASRLALLRELIFRLKQSWKKPRICLEVI